MAQACGGCFAMAPDPRNPTGIQTVTDHRMVLSVSLTRTTLWDQFSWSGNPSEFSWILPIVNGPEVRVELASDDFLTMLDNLSSPQLQPPSQPYRVCSYCQSPYRGCPYYETDNAAQGGRGAYAGADASSGAPAEAGAGDAGVTIYRQETVGPYEVVVLGGQDPMALRNWLTSHQFVVPASMEPTLQYYIDRHMDFVALRLAASTSSSRMQPVRVTMPGALPVLPLRMVGAGVADRVGLSLFVLSVGRMQTDNFPNTELTDRDLAWDYSAPSYDLGMAFRGAERRLSLTAGDRAWNTEFAGTLGAGVLEQTARTYDNFRRAPPGGPDAGSADAGAAATTLDDTQLATSGLGPDAYLTRLRADLPAAALDRDLMLSPALNTARGRAYRFGTLRNMPTPAECAPLHCQPGDTQVNTGDYILGPYGETFASATRFTTEYTVGSATSIPTPAPTSTLVPGLPPPLYCPGPDGGVTVLPDGAVVPGNVTQPSCQCGAAPGAGSRGYGALLGLAGVVLGASVARRKRR